MPERPDNLMVLVSRAVGSVEALDPDPEGPDAAAFARQLAAARPGLFEPLGDDSEAAGRALAAAMLHAIREIPLIVEAMLSAIDRRTTDPAIRCALAGALAYLVRPRDLLPDNLPGGYGLVDDSVILRATATEFLDALPRGFTTIERERAVLDLLAAAIPDGRLPEFQAEVEGIWLAFHVLLWKAEDEIEEATARLVADPLGAPLPVSDRESIPLPPGPLLAAAPGNGALCRDGAGWSLRASDGSAIRFDRAGRIAPIA